MSFPSNFDFIFIFSGIDNILIPLRLYPKILFSILLELKKFMLKLEIVSFVVNK